MALIKIFSLFALVFIYKTIEGPRIHAKAENVEAELEKRLAILNKPPIKTFKFDYGIFDCVDIYKQPAFDHPLLKDHKIQLVPTHSSIGVKKERYARSNRFGILPGCPNGTVPIRRTTKKDLIGEKSLEQVHHYYPNTKDKPNVHFAVVEIYTGKQFSGGKAKIDVHNPQCNMGDTNGAQIWLFNVHRGNVGDGISAGWMVDPMLYGEDAHTFLTATWVGKEQQGCSNAKCPGFVQVDTTVPLGLLLPNISKYGGTLYKISVSIAQDKDTRNWWLSVGLGGDEVKVGYWPKEIFYNLDEGAKTISYGGVVRRDPDQTETPPMGSGLSEKCRYDHTAFISNMKFTEFGDDKVYVPKRSHTKRKADCPNYKVYYQCRPSKDLEFYFVYGGPRASC